MIFPFKINFLGHIGDIDRQRIDIAFETPNYIDVGGNG
jgi:hypothetical protein